MEVPVRGLKEAWVWILHQLQAKPGWKGAQVSNLEKSVLLSFKSSLTVSWYSWHGAFCWIDASIGICYSKEQPNHGDYNDGFTQEHTESIGVLGGINADPHFSLLEAENAFSGISSHYMPRNSTERLSAFCDHNKRFEEHHSYIVMTSWNWKALKLRMLCASEAKWCAG